MNNPLSRLSIPSFLRTGRKSKSFAGRNSHGRITVRHRGGGHKRSYRQLNWKLTGGSGVIVGFYYDPYRSARLAKILYVDDSNNSKKSYSLVPVSKGRTLFQPIKTYNYDFASTRSLESVVLRPGDRTILTNFEPGDIVNSVSFEKNGKPLFARSAGTSCQIRSIENKSAILRRPSGQLRRFAVTARASVGSIQTEEKSTLARGLGISKGHDNLGLRKAGRSRWLGRRPTVRGTARNPVDHPHGGNSRGRPSVTFRGWPTKGRPTRRSKLNTNLFIK